MVKVRVLLGDDDEVIGTFEMPSTPRAGETIYVPWEADTYGSRCFTVGEVEHVAAGVPELPQYGPSPITVLRYCVEL